MMDKDLFLKTLLKENDNKKTLNNKDDFYIKVITELNKFLSEKKTGIHLDTSKDMFISYDSGTFSWDIALSDGTELISFNIFYSQDGNGSGIRMTSNSTLIRTNLAVAINIIVNYYYSNLSVQIQRNMPNKAF